MSPAGTRERLYLRTSPEFACKKLLAAGERRIVEFARSFRNRERGALHHPEFTLIEWYRANEPYEVLMDDCAAILALAARDGRRDAGSRSGTGRSIPSPRPSGWRSRRRSRATPASISWRCCRRNLPARFAAAAAAAGIRTAADDNWGDIFSRVLVEKIEPRLGLERATILYEYPAVQSPLARPSRSDPRLAERFELYACGVELANGFGELTDAGEQRTRLERADGGEGAHLRRALSDRRGVSRRALAAMPPACGIALGFDRLVMLATGATRIEQVLWTPMSEN